MSRLIPPLKAIRYFEVAAEFESFSKAADELNVSKGAISQQINILEQYLGVALFRRSGRGVFLTDIGRRYHSASRSAFNVLEQETKRIVGSRKRSQLRLTVLPAFASLWLVPRLTGFQKHMAHIDIVVSADAEIVDFAKSDNQVGIRYGTPTEKGLEVTKLGTDVLTPVCSPEYAEHNGLNSPSDLENCVLLHDTFWSDDWPRWLSEAGMADQLGGEGQFFTHYSMAIETARNGGGVAMGHKLLLADLIDQGNLVCPLEPQICSVEPYLLVIPEHAAHLDVVQQFQKWLVDSFAEGIL